MKKHFILTIVLLFTTVLSFAQSKFFSKESDWYIEPSFRYGINVPFVSRHSYITDYPQYSADIRLGYQSLGDKEWEQRFMYPTFGFIFRYEHNTLDSAKREYRDNTGAVQTEWVGIGDSYTVGAFMNGIFYRNRYWTLDYSIICGLSFWPKYGNEFIGSPLDVHLGLDVGPTIRISPKLDINARFWFAHSSNGALVLPNHGVNAYGYQLGCRYHINDRKEFKYKPLSEFNKKTYIFLSEAVGALQSNTKLGNQISGEPGYYFCNTFRFGIARHFHPQFRYDLGFDFCWTGETKLKYELAQERYNQGALNVPLEEYSPWKSSHLAVSGMFEVLYDRFAFCLGFAYYLYHGIYAGTDEKKTWTFKESEMSAFEHQYLPSAYQNYYERLGFKYYMGKKGNQFVGAFMKVHKGSIDYIEWTYGINLNVSKK